MRGEVLSTTAPSPFLPFAYELGRRRSTGVLALESAGEPLSIREGAVVASDLDVVARQAAATLDRIATLDRPAWSFRPAPVSGSVTGPLLPLARWARRHLERAFDMETAARLTRDLAGARLCLRPCRAPAHDDLDEADRRLVIALSRPRALRELAAAARTSRFRLLAFLHFARSVGALSLS